jgi:hypothetical protein
MKMAKIDYTKELLDILQVLHTEDVENGEILRLILYDWSIKLTYCLAVFQLMPEFDTLSLMNSAQHDVLEEAERRLDELIMFMRNALMNDSREK